jgi:hypothetical protein
MLMAHADERTDGLMYLLQIREVQCGIKLFQPVGRFWDDSVTHKN